MLDEAPAAMLCLLVPAFQALRSALKSQRELALENLALRQQLATLRQQSGRPNLRLSDRLFWAALSHMWSKWREALVIVEPETVMRWHRLGFKLFWRWKSRGGERGSKRKSTPAELRELIRKMATANLGWGAPRIHGELLKLGFQVSQATVSRHMPKRRRPLRSQTWRTFLDNHLGWPCLDRLLRRADRDLRPSVRPCWCCGISGGVSCTST